MSEGERRAGGRGSGQGRRSDGSGRGPRRPAGGGGRPERSGDRAIRGRGEGGGGAARPDVSPRAGEQGTRGGSRLVPRSPRLPEPAVPEEVTGKELDRAVHHQLRTLSKENAEGVGAHLVMVAQLLDSNLDAAEAHAETAVRRAGRVPAASGWG